MLEHAPLCLYGRARSSCHHRRIAAAGDQRLDAQDETTDEDDEFLLGRPERRDFVHAVFALAHRKKTRIVKLTWMGIVYIIEQYSEKRQSAVGDP